MNIKSLLNKKKFPAILGTLLIGLVLMAVSVNVVSAMNPNIADYIKGLPLGKQILIISQKQDELKLQNDLLKKELNATKQELESTKNQLATAEAKLNSQGESISTLKTQNQAISKRVDCQELVKQTPNRGDGQLIGINIVKFYASMQARLEQVKNNPTRPQEQEADIAFNEAVLAEAKPMYNKYIAQCGN